MTLSTTMLRAALIAGLLVCPALVSAGQAPPARPGTAPPPLPGQTGPAPAQPGTASTPPPVSEAYTYNPEGRRDPFVSLVFRGTDLKPSTEARPPGLPGMLIAEITLRGIVKDRSGFVAMVSGPDNKTHIVRASDKVFDGTVKVITADSIIFSQDVNDPLSLVKQREVRKYLRATQEGK